jgi:hypothetical protein
MTKTSKTAAITFPTVKNLNAVKRNIETGVEIHGSRGEYAVVVPSRDHRTAPRVFRTLAEARVEAITQVEMWREAIAAAYDDAVIEIYDGLQTIEQAVANRAAEYPALAALYAAAWHSYDMGFVSAANERLYRCLDHLTGVALLPSRVESEAALAEALTRMPVGTTVRTDRGVADVTRPPYVAAESGRVVLPLRFLAKGYGSAYADSVKVD